MRRLPTIILRVGAPAPTKRRMTRDGASVTPQSVLSTPSISTTVGRFLARTHKAVTEGEGDGAQLVVYHVGEGTTQVDAPGGAHFGKGSRDAIMARGAAAGRERDQATSDRLKDMNRRAAEKWGRK